MHRLLVTPALFALLALLPVLAGCGLTNPLTGTTAGGGIVTRESKLLGSPIPSGMEFYPEHSRLEGGDGMEIFRGDASATRCASMLTNDLQARGWQLRLAQAGETRALYAFEKDGRLAILTIQPQSPTALTLLTIYTSSTPPQAVPLPVRKQSSFNFGFGSSSSSNASSGSTQASPAQDYPTQSAPYDAGGLSTAPESDYGSGSGTLQERDL